MAFSKLTLEEIHGYFMQNGGTVSNREVVKHFRHYLTDQESRDDARQKFKKYINKIANSCNEGDQKILSLKPRYMLNSDDTSLPMSSQAASPKYDPRNAIGIPASPASPITSSPIRAPPPYRPPPPVVVTSPSGSIFDNISLSSSTLSLNDSPTPQAPPRKRTSTIDKSQFNSQGDLSAVTEKENERPDNGEKQTVSVKERTQKFNRLASVDDELSSPKQNQIKSKKKQKQGVDEDDGASVTSLEPKQCSAWYVAAAKGDYQELAKLASRESRLVKLKDPYTATVLHWGAKHGNVDIIKLFAGNYKADVNAKTNGGYVPLHLAAQFGHDDAYDLLVQVYKADVSIRDFSGRKPEQYKTSHIQDRIKVVNKSKSRKNKHGDKEMGFLRIGSLNVRVKKTTEAFSSFLGVGGGSMSSIEPISEKVHKGWGSADNLGHVRKRETMPAPKTQAAKRKSKRPLEQHIGTHSNPGTPNQQQKVLQMHSLQDSDSDTAAGFDSHWQN